MVAMPSSQNGMKPPSGLFLAYILSMALRDVKSGAGTYMVLLKRPERLRAGSTSHGALVAAMMSTFWLLASTPSIS